MKRLVCLLLAVAAAVALAGLYLPSSAATVGSTTISRQSLDSDLSAIAGSPDYTCFLSEERQLSSGNKLPFLGAGTANVRGGVYDSTFVDDWLGSMITDQISAGVLASHGLRVTAADLAVARRVLARHMTQVLDQYARDVQSSPACGGSGEAVLSTLPAWFVRQQTSAEADQILLDAHAAGAGLSKAAVAGYFARHRRSFDRVCLDLVIVRTEAAAAGVERALARGVTFAHEAETSSITTSSAAQGGSIGCGFVDGTFLATAVDRLATGATTAPVQSQGVYWIVRLTKRSTVPLGSIRSSVVTAMFDAGQQRANAELTAAFRKANIGVDPRYGTASHHHLTLVLGAPSPPSTSEISIAANRPALTAASS